MKTTLLVVFTSKAWKDLGIISCF